MSCKLCETRRPRRFCPGVRGDICSICCGTEREVTVDCPFECEYLQDARRHERPVEIPPEQYPNQDVRLTERFLREHQALVVFLGRVLLEAALRTPGTVDGDVRDALDSLARTYRTLQSGVYYQTRPNNSIAAQICELVEAALANFRREEPERLGMTKTRDADVLGAMVFLQRIEAKQNNGRRRGRAFLDYIRARFEGLEGLPPVPAPASHLIVP